MTAKQRDHLAPIEFDDMKRKEVPVRIGNRQYILFEAMAGDVINYRNFMVRATRVDAGRKTASVGEFADAEIRLLSDCIREVRDKGYLKVSMDTIRLWSNQIKNTLWRRLQAISDMIDDESVEDLLEQRDLINEKLTKLGYCERSDEPAHDVDGSSPENLEGNREEAIKN